ncbi:Protein FAM195A [Acipenser ruthenus]|uniref:Protein FAM195A n=1 Tax=Acipenser ruthenus TaxID=7906 RepID=A0A444TXL2_ACIRT|nr:Protein FAM195A [Acipenser ruthenus]
MEPRGGRGQEGAGMREDRGGIRKEGGQRRKQRGGGGRREQRGGRRKQGGGSKEEGAGRREQGAKREKGRGRKKGGGWQREPGGKREQEGGRSSPAQKLVFNRVNGKRSHTPVPQTDSQGEGYTAAHQDNVNFVYEAWQEVEQRLGHSRGAENGHGPVQYTETSPSPSLKSESSICSMRQ